MRIVVAGPKSSGKSTIAKLLESYLGLGVVETDQLIEELYAKESGKQLTCREICQVEGEPEFRDIEHRAIADSANLDWKIISTGGATMMDPDSRRSLRKNSIVVLLNTDSEILWQRMTENGLPPFYRGKDGYEVFKDRLQRIIEVLYPFADVFVETTNLTPEEAAEKVIAGISEELATRATEPNTLGTSIRITTFGESHGPAIGCVLDGVPPGINLCEADIQVELDRRRPGQSAVTTPRTEPDKIKIISGLFEGKTTGAPICMYIENTNQDSARYDYLREIFRPGHADFTYWHKFGIRDHRGGGRSSGRETAGRVAGGAIAKRLLSERGVQINAHALEIAGVKAEKINIDDIEKNPVRCADMEKAAEMIAAIETARDNGDSVGGIIQLHVNGLPVGLGDPVFNKLDSLLGRAVLSLGAVKGIEFGSGFSAAKMKGSQHNDPIRTDGFVSNNSGGILGGISNGDEIIMRIAVKPTASISSTQDAATVDSKNIEVSVLGRHDPCIIPRVIPVVENLAALVLLDLWETQKRIRPDWEG